MQYQVTNITNAPVEIQLINGSFIYNSTVDPHAVIILEASNITSEVFANSSLTVTTLPYNTISVGVTLLVVPQKWVVSFVILQENIVTLATEFLNNLDTGENNFQDPLIRAILQVPGVYLIKNIDWFIRKIPVGQLDLIGPQEKAIAGTITIVKGT